MLAFARARHRSDAAAGDNRESTPAAVGEPDVGGRRWAVLWPGCAGPHRLIRGLVAQVARRRHLHAGRRAGVLLLLLALPVPAVPARAGDAACRRRRARGLAARSRRGGRAGRARTRSLEGVIRGAPRPAAERVAVLGAVLALWSASTAITGLTAALNVAYGVRERRPWWRVRIMAIALTVAMSFFMIVAFVLAVSSAPLAALVAGMLGPLGGHRPAAGELAGRAGGDHVGDRDHLPRVSRRRLPLALVLARVGASSRSDSRGTTIAVLVLRRPLRLVRQDLRLARRGDHPAALDVPRRRCSWCSAAR